jgi:hypothetical protein
MDSDSFQSLVRETRCSVPSDTLVAATKTFGGGYHENLLVANNVVQHDAAILRFLLQANMYLAS